MINILIFINYYVIETFSCPGSSTDEYGTGYYVKNRSTFTGQTNNFHLFQDKVTTCTIATTIVNNSCITNIT